MTSIDGIGVLKFMLGVNDLVLMTERQEDHLCPEVKVPAETVVTARENVRRQASGWHA